MKILVCDDDKEIARAIGVYLRNEGFEAVLAYDGAQALELCETEDIKLILMDIMMPVMDGIQAVMRIRESRNIPIIILSAKSEDYDKITGLNVGADDYITKPFNPLELVARVKAQLRRYTNFGTIKEKKGIYTTGGLVLDDGEKSVSVDGKALSLTPLEYGILRFLMESPGQVFSMDQIYEAVWNEPAYNSGSVVPVHIRRIREKIEINPKEPEYLKVVWGIGYKIEKF